MRKWYLVLLASIVTIGFGLFIACSAGGGGGGGLDDDDTNCISCTDTETCLTALGAGWVCLDDCCVEYGDDDTTVDDDATDDDTVDDDAGDDDINDDDTIDDDTADDDTNDDDTIEPGTIGGTCLDFLSESPIPGAAVEALRDDTGASFDPPVTAVSNSTGDVQLTLPAEYDLTYVAIKLTADNYKATFQFHFTVGATEGRFLGVSNTTVSLIAALLGLTVDPTKGHAAGGVFWGDPSDETPVGCAEVSLNPTSGTFYYMDDLGLPTHDRDITTPGDPQNGEGTNPQNGYFWGLNANPRTHAAGGYQLTANADGNVGNSSLPKLDADSMAISNVYFSKTDYTSNPQGDWCTE